MQMEAKKLFYSCRTPLIHPYLMLGIKISIINSIDNEKLRLKFILGSVTG